MGQQVEKPKVFVASKLLRQNNPDSTSQVTSDASRLRTFPKFVSLTEEAKAQPPLDILHHDHQWVMPGITSVRPLSNSTKQPDLFTQLQARNLAKASIDKPLVVYVFPLHRKDKNFLVDELKHFVHDGIMNSPYVNLTTDIRQADLWIAQTLLGFAPSRWCHRVHGFVQDIFRRGRRPFPRYKPPLVLMEWHDNIPITTCMEILPIMGRESVFYTKRAIVTGRRYNRTSREIELGHVESFANWSQFAGAPLRHTPYAVRSDFVQGLEQVVGKPLSQVDLVARKRGKDVAHFWPLTGRGVDRGGPYGNSKLRDDVSRTLMELRRDRKLKIFCNLAGEANLVGRNAVDLKYPEKILQYKVVVVAQKDTHEEHYRLMEALVSGALVMSDVMLSIPPDFVDGESIIFYHNMTDLQNKVLYYLDHPKERLEIARRGWILAFHRHRSWHRMEEVFFGKILSASIRELQ